MTKEKKLKIKQGLTRKPRKLTTKKRETWTQLRKEIEKIRSDFGLTDKLKPVGLSEWKKIQSKVLEKFYKVKMDWAGNTLIGWAGDNLKCENEGLHVHTQPYLLLDILIDRTNEVFLLIDDGTPKFWVYESTVLPIKTLLAESAWFYEAMIVDKKFNWILCFNHHDIIIAGGQEMVDKLKQLKLKFNVK